MFCNDYITSRSEIDCKLRRLEDSIQILDNKLFGLQEKYLCIYNVSKVLERDNKLLMEYLDVEVKENPNQFIVVRRTEKSKL